MSVTASGRPGLGRGLADRVQPALERELVQARDRQAGEDLDARVEVAVDALEVGEGLLLAADERGRVLDAPMRRHRLPRPDRADLVRRVVADREHEIER